MSTSLQKRMYRYLQTVLSSYRGSWMVWCDPRGEWQPLLERVAADKRMGGFELVCLNELTSDQFGNPAKRAELQERIDQGSSFVLSVPVAADQLGWLWSQALLAEQIYERRLVDQLRDWGWKPGDLTISDDEVAALARQHLQEDPAEWNSGGIQPDIALLLEVLAGGAKPQLEVQFVLALTIAEAGLPDYDEKEPDAWRTKSLACLLISQAYCCAPERIPEQHELLIAPPKRTMALQVLERWRDSLRLSKRLPDAVVKADQIAGLASYVDASDIAKTPFLSQAAEEAIFSDVCTQLKQVEGKVLLQSLADMESDLHFHTLGFWGRPSLQHVRAIPWGELERLSWACRVLLEASADLPWPDMLSAIEWYTSIGWQLDRAGDEIMRNLEKPVPQLLELIKLLRPAYRARWEHHMMAWSEIWVQSGCTFPDLLTAGAWLSGELENRRATAILSVDAFRYDIGTTLAQRINEQEGAERATVVPARAPLPSITALGMAAALPVAEANLHAKLSGGKWQIYQSGKTRNLSDAAQRRAWWQQYLNIPDQGFISLSQLQAGDMPSPTRELPYLIIHDAILDRMGHDDELEHQGHPQILQRYINVVERLREAGWHRILVVTDHGYILWPSSEEKDAKLPAPDPTYKSRRAIAYPIATNILGPQALAPGGSWRIAFPWGAASFRAYGGLGYFHGGASLQEWIIPCITVVWPSQAKPLDLVLDPLEKILTQRPRVRLNVVSSSLLIEEDLPRKAEVLIRDAGQHTILFRSEQVLVKPSEGQVSVTLVVAKGSVASRGNALHIEVRDASTEEVLDRKESTLSIELTGW